MTSTPLLETHEAAFGYHGRAVLGGVSMAIATGDRVGVVGPNGAGKSTLLRGLLGLVRPLAGQASIAGEHTVTLRREEIARRIAFLPQDVRPAPGLTALEVVLLGRAARRSTGAAAWAFDTTGDVAAAQAALTEVGAARFAGRLFKELSGGERRLVLLALALAQAEQGILLDEPTASLDLRASAAVGDRILALTGPRNLAVVLVTHDISLAARVCNRIVLVGHDAAARARSMDGGHRPAAQVLADGPPDQVIRSEVLGPAFGLPLGVSIPDGAVAPVVYPAGTGPS